MMPLFVIRKHFGNHLGKHLGLLLSIAACAVVVGTQARSTTQRSNDQGLLTELGLESAWPHVRVDFSR